MRILSDGPLARKYGYSDDAHDYILHKIRPKGKISRCNVMPLKTRVVTNDHMVVRIDREEYIEETEIEDSFSINNQYEIVVLSDYDKGTIKNPQSVISQSKRVIVDPKVPLSFYKNAYVLKPNKKEFEDYIGEYNLSPKHLLVHARRVRDELNIENFIVTLGAEGVLLVGDQIEHYPAISSEVADVTGAGDTFTATLAICLWMNMSMYQAVRISNTMAGEAVKTHGTYLINYNKLVEEIENEKSLSNG